jgi:hypothetical protein
MARDDMRKSQALHGFCDSEPILPISQFRNPSERINARIRWR